MDHPPCNKVALSNPWQLNTYADFLDGSLHGPSLDCRLCRLQPGPRIWEDYSPDSWPAKPNHDGQHFSVSNSSTSATAETKFALPSNFVMEALSGNTDPEVHSYLKDHQVTGANLAPPKASSVPQLLDYLMTTNAHTLPAQRRVSSPNESTANSYAYKAKAQSSCSGSLYKTELCRSWCENSTCRYGNKCQFAHGHAELRPLKRHPKYKTEICRTFATSGTCPYGIRCRFIHMMPPLTQPEPPAGQTEYPSNPQSLHPLPRQPLDYAFSVDSYLSSFVFDFPGNSTSGTGHIADQDNLDLMGRRSPSDPFQHTMQPLHHQSLDQGVLPVFAEEQLSHSLGSCSINNDFSTATHNTGPLFNLGSHTGIGHGQNYALHGGLHPTGVSDLQRRLAIFKNLSHSENGRP